MTQPRASQNLLQAVGTLPAVTQSNQYMTIFLDANDEYWILTRARRELLDPLVNELDLMTQGQCAHALLHAWVASWVMWNGWRYNATT